MKALIIEGEMHLGGGVRERGLSIDELISITSGGEM